MTGFSPALVSTAAAVTVPSSSGLRRPNPILIWTGAPDARSELVLPVRGPSRKTWYSAR